MGGFIVFILTILFIGFLLCVAYAWGRKNEDGTRFYDKTQLVLSTVWIGCIYFIVNLPVIIRFF